MWYADDSAAAGKIVDVFDWFSAVKAEGKPYGSNIRLSKSVAIIKPEREAHFREVFADEIAAGLRVVAVSSEGVGSSASQDQDEGAEIESMLGAKYLGVGVGSPAFRKGWVMQKVSIWQKQIARLASFGKTHPREAYCLLVKTLIPRFLYTMRTIDAPPELYDPLDSALNFFSFLYLDLTPLPMISSVGGVPSLLDSGVWPSLRWSS